MNTARPRRRPGFTLVELLIVIGIIAVLISMLLPMVAKVREQGKQVQCLSNLRSLGTAMLSYAADNDNYLPATSRCVVDGNGKYPMNDWVWWQQNRIPSYGVEQMEHSALARYLNLSVRLTAKGLNLDNASLAVFRCPSDDYQTRLHIPSPAPNGSGPYPFSYVMNWFIAGESNLPAAGVTGQQGYQGPSPGLCTTLAKVLNPSQKILMYEEDQSTIDDGNGQPWMGSTQPFNASNPAATTGVGGSINLLALRHEWTKAPVGAPLQSTTGPMSSAVPDPDARGNVVFCDGHGEFVSRAFVHRPDHTIASQ